MLPPNSAMTPITIETTVHAPLSHVWACWTDPAHITQWLHASDDWECPSAHNDVRVGGRFSSRMQAKDGSAGFDFEGTYTTVEPERVLAYSMDDGRTVRIAFTPTADGVHIAETFDPETEHPIDMQREGWQSILDTFATYIETVKR